MPKVIVRVLNSKIEDGKIIATIKCNQKCPKVGELATLKWGSTRTLAQNSLLWVFLTWCINEGGLKNSGHFTPDALHQDLKAYFLAEKIMIRGEFVAIEDPTTTTLDKTQFGEYMDKIDKLFNDPDGYFRINTAPFWEEYERDWKI